MRSALAPPWTGSVTIVMLAREASLKARQRVGQPSVSSSKPGFGSSAAARARADVVIQPAPTAAAPSPAAPPSSVRRLILVDVMIGPFVTEAAVPGRAGR